MKILKISRRLKKEKDRSFNFTRKNPKKFKRLVFFFGFLNLVGKEMKTKQIIRKEKPNHLYVK
jgi:hypothetical protein